MKETVVCVVTIFIRTFGTVTLLLTNSYVKGSPITEAIDMQLPLRKIIGHLPRKISRACSLFLRRGNEITCHVTGHRRYSVDLPQGGLEVPCILRFEGDTKEIVKLKNFVKPELPMYAAEM